MRTIFGRGIRLTALLLTVVLIYTVMLLVVYSFPDEWIRHHVEAAVNVLVEEGNMVGGYGNYFWHNSFGITDKLTDITIYQGLLRDGQSVIEAAMRTDYARYWHGYAVVLRPLLTVLSIINIRYLNMMLLMLLFLACGWRCCDLFGWRTSMYFCAGLLMAFLLVAPFCQQYMSVSFLTLAFCAAVLYGWRVMHDRLYECFFLMGSLVCFFDFLTFPVLALGYPLVCCLLCMIREDRDATLLWKATSLLSVVWALGYGLTWVAKGAVGTLLTGQNVMDEILSQAAFRMTGAFHTGTYDVEISAYSAISINLESFFMGANVAFFLLLLLVESVVVLRKRHVMKIRWSRALPVAVVALWPFLWYCVLQNHSRMHFWMTYKSLSVTVFAACSALTALTAFTKNDGDVAEASSVQKRA